MKDVQCISCDYNCTNRNCLIKQAHEAWQVIFNYADEEAESEDKE